MLLVRNLQLAIAIFLVISLLIAYFFMERYLLLEPCPICIIDRILYGLIMLTALGLAYLSAKGRSVAFLLTYFVQFGLFALSLAVAIWHEYLTLRPYDPTSPGCASDGGTGEFNLLAIIAEAFSADADCGLVSWYFLGLSIPDMVLLSLLFCVLLSGYGYYTIRRKV